MRAKTAYRRKSENTPVENIPAENTPPEIQAENTPVENNNSEPVQEIPAPEPQAAQPPIATPDPPSAESALLGQIEALRRGEQLQREQREQIQRAADAQAKCQAWVQETPLAQKYYGRLSGLHAEVVGTGVAYATPQYFAAMDGKLEALNANESNEAPAMETPKFFTPPPPSSMPRPSERSNNFVPVSAPVSRGAPGASISRDKATTLTPNEVEAAKVSGISLEEYAHNKLKYQGMLQSGEYRREGQ